LCVAGANRGGWRDWRAVTCRRAAPRGFHAFGRFPAVAGSVRAVGESRRIDPVVTRAMGVDVILMRA